MPYIRMLCEFELGRKRKDVPTVDVRLSEARFRRRRDPWDLDVVFPRETGAGEYEGDDEDQKLVGMFCPTFVVELDGSQPGDGSIDDAFAQVLDVATAVADAVWTAQQAQGFAGSIPKIIRHELEVDGVPQRHAAAERHGTGAIYVGFPRAKYEEVQGAVVEGMRPSEARMLLAQATRWGLAEHFSSRSAALLLAAIACEVAIKTAVSQDPHHRLGTLVPVLVPEGRQAPLSPAALLEHCLPVVTGRFAQQDAPGLIVRYKKLTKLRDTIVHTGQQIDKSALVPHLNTARELVGWIEGQQSESHRS